ncbi:hypothetical protein D3C73_502100 [compost metagenome]
MLCALTAEHHPHRRGTFVRRTIVEGQRSQGFNRFRTLAGNDVSAVPEQRSGIFQVGDKGRETAICLSFEKLPIGNAQVSQSVVVFGRNGDQGGRLMADRKASHRYCRCSLENQVRIVATQPETANTNDDVRLVDCNRFTVDLKRCFFNV